MDSQNLGLQTRQYFSRECLGNVSDDTIRRVIGRMVALSLDEIFDDYDCFLRPSFREGETEKREKDREKGRCSLRVAVGLLVAPLGLSWMTDGDSCCIAVAAKNISPAATLSPLLLLLYLETSVFPPSLFPPCVPRFPRFPPPFTLSTPTNAFSFRVARRILLLRLLAPLLLGGVR